MPIYSCRECGVSRDFSVPELAAKVKVPCPIDGNRMQYVGNMMPAWYQGHGLDSLILILLLLVGLHQGTNSYDNTEKMVFLGVGLVMAAFEIGRLTVKSDLAVARANFGHLRVIVFMVSTLVLLFFSQKNFDQQEAELLTAMSGAIVVWHFGRYALLRIKLKSIAGNVAEGMVKKLVSEGLRVAVIAAGTAGGGWLLNGKDATAILEMLPI